MGGFCSVCLPEQPSTIYDSVQNSEPATYIHPRILGRNQSTASSLTTVSSIYSFSSKSSFTSSYKRRRIRAYRRYGEDETSSSFDDSSNHLKPPSFTGSQILEFPPAMHVNIGLKRRESQSSVNNLSNSCDSGTILLGEYSIVRPTPSSPVHNNLIPQITTSPTHSKTFENHSIRSFENSESRRTSAVSSSSLHISLAGSDSCSQYGSPSLSHSPTSHSPSHSPSRLSAISPTPFKTACSDGEMLLKLPINMDSAKFKKSKSTGEVVNHERRMSISSNIIMEGSPTNNRLNSFKARAYLVPPIK